MIHIWFFFFKQKTAYEMRISDWSSDVCSSDLPVIAGAGSNCTDEAIALTKHAKSVGADGALLITPYYNKPMQEGLYRHYKAVAESVKIGRASCRERECQYV